MSLCNTKLLYEDDFIALNKLLWAKAINILHWFLNKPIRKYRLKDPDFDLIEVSVSDIVQGSHEEQEF